jgi:hypothetical protein
MSDQAMRMEMLREVSLRADNFYGEAEKLGTIAAKALTDKKRSQISGLQATANSALKTTDVFNYIKLRTARQPEWQQGRWGIELLEYLSRDLRTDRKEICGDLGIQDPNSPEGLEVHLMLIREFVGQLAAQYEYACKFPHAGGGS